MMNAARGIFLAARRRGPKLPYDAEVEYLGLSGGQYIDSGETVSDALGYSVDCSDTSYNMWICGGRMAYRTGAVGLYRVSTTDIQFSFGNASHSRVYGTLRHVVRFQGRGCYVDDNLSYTFAPATFSNSSPFYIGNLSINTDGTPSNVGMHGKLYGAQVYIGSQVVRDFISVRFTNELGQSEGAMYDRANPTVGMNPDGSPRTDGLYRNLGSGAFTWADKTA